MLTRRQQLALAAQQKQEKEEMKASGRGGSRGGGRGGRGKGRGRGKKAPKEIQHPEDVVMEAPDVEKKSSSSKGVVGQSTPERRRLFPESPVAKREHPEPVVASTRSTPVKQEPKKARKTRKAKTNEGPEGKGDSKDAKKQDAQEAGGKQKEEDAKEKEDNEKKNKNKQPPTKAQQDQAMQELTEAKADPAVWEHVLKLFEATHTPERDHAGRLTYWALSMYWNTHRVGLLQKHAGRASTHVLSMGGGHCKHIGIPAAACRLFVGVSAQ